MVDTLDLELHMQPCAEPAVMDLTIDEQKSGFSKHIGGAASVDDTYDIVKATRFGNVTVSVRVAVQTSAEHVVADIELLDACGSTHGHEGCASKLPFSKFPVSVISMNKDLGHFCDVSAAVV